MRPFKSGFHQSVRFIILSALTPTILNQQVLSFSLQASSLREREHEYRAGIELKPSYSASDCSNNLANGASSKGGELKFIPFASKLNLKLEAVRFLMRQNQNVLDLSCCFFRLEVHHQGAPVQQLQQHGELIISEQKIIQL